MGRKRMQEQLIGICLLPDSYIPHHLTANHLNSGRIIGSVYTLVEGKTCTQLRQVINQHIKAPKDFCFLNSSGWPFDASLENKIIVKDCLVSGVVTIQNKHGDFSRVGIKLLNDHILGFIFLNFNFAISDVRKTIYEELKDQFESNETFEFVENNAWPVRKSQEEHLSVWNLVVNNCITIVKKPLKRMIENEDVKLEKRRKLKKNQSIDSLYKEDLNFHSILISYVHQEATTYARDLKRALRKMGFKKIFLDIDDISAGQDWQDVISLAVSNCTIFIPLVTPRYGETRWTNREAKLADDREKTIIPISFLDKWPPDQLAIQFVTLQYIPWKTTDEMNGGSYNADIKFVWNPKSVQRVANEIKKLCPEEASTPDSVSLLDGNFRSSQNLTLNLSQAQKNRFNGKSQKDFVVISAHSQQEKFVNEITEMLKSCGYQVWSSMNMCECDEDNFSPLEDTQPLINSPMIERNGFSPVTLHFDDRTIPHSSSGVKELKRNFKDKVRDAKLVVLIFSEEYLKSRICRQQLFYCEQRTKVIVIKHGNFKIDSMFLNLYPEHEMITKENWECLKFKIKEKLKFDSEDSYRSNIMLSVSKLKNFIDTNITVYVIGGTNKISSSAKAFCLVLGTELAKVKGLNLATEGFYGTGELVAKNFCEEQEIQNRSQSPNVYHIVPTKDNSDYSEKAKRQTDGSFEKLPYGNTLYYGMSVANRNDIVAAAFKLCILIEGGERSACLAEKFLWNECIVIPVLFNNTTVKSKPCLEESITKVPNGVNESDWKKLNLTHCSPEERAKVVKRIVCALLHL